MGIATQLIMQISGQDRTGEAFGSVAKKAAAAQSKLKSMLGGALAGIGVGMIAKGAKSAYDEMGTISDRAQQMGTSAVYAQQLAQALDMVGIKGVNLDTLSDAFGKMTKETGAVGAKGFEDTLAKIAAMGNEQERVNALMTAFGRTVGASLAPLVRQGPEALRDGLHDVMAAMPAVSDASINMGDAVSDSLKIAGNKAKAAWQEVLGNIASWMGDTFKTTPSAAMDVFTEHIRFGVRAAWAHIHAFGANIGKIAAYFTEDWRGALNWVWEGVKEVFTSVFNFVWQTLKSIGNIAVELGKHIWSSIKGEGFDWSGFAESAKKEFAKVGASGKEMLHAFKIEGNDALKLEVPDIGKLREERDANIAATAKQAAGVAKLASGTVITDTAQQAVKAVKDAAKNTFVEASTYEAVKIALAEKSGASVFGQSVPRRSAGPVNGVAAEGAESLLAAISKGVAAMSERLSAIDGRLLNLEAV